MSTFLPLIGVFLIFGFASAGKARVTREPAAPEPIDCWLSTWSEWGPCNPCTKESYRSRSVLRYGQFGGRPCLESLGDRKRCVPDSPCPDEQSDCGNDFTCDNGHCIKKRLLCNTEDDCGDMSDEAECEDMNLAPCRDRIIDVSEIGRTAGRGLNILGLEPRESPFFNEFYNGMCDRVRDGNSGIYFRKPWNVAVLNYDTKGDKRFTEQYYDDQVTTMEKMFSFKEKTFNVDLSLKLIATEPQGSSAPAETQAEQSPSETQAEQSPSETQDEAKQASGTGDTAASPPKSKHDAHLTFNFKSSKTSNISTFLRETKGKNYRFLHVKANLELGTFIMRRRDLRLTETFLDDLKNLPSQYEKGEYFSFLETHGTHYAQKGTVGGKYELIYILDNETMTREGVSVSDVKDCLGYNLDTGINMGVLDASFTAGGRDCKNNTIVKAFSSSHKPIITDVISLVQGGKTIALARLKEMLSRGGKVVDVEDYVQWAATLPDNPTVIKQETTPISALVPLNMLDADIKKQNLDQAVEDYVAEYNVCKCKPCLNGGTALLVNGRCECGCSSYFKGEACEIPTSTIKAGQVAIDGGWSCWSSWSSCEQGQRLRTRTCNNPEASGGKPCAGAHSEPGYC
ncbi:complement component C9 [Varanus komodoensis]|uniref:Complement component C9 n=1 Tax=Varanus komodoensis TaxID=61221 RepID=A0A8D2JEV3_VARKO|nr:complement component C9 [Varanus komodoensis]